MAPRDVGERSRALHARARRLLPGSVSSPARSLGPMGGVGPLFVDRAEGAYLYDVDGRAYLDYLQAFGPGILGHAHPAVTQAVTDQARRGVLYGASTPGEAELAERLAGAIPSLAALRFVSTGTEAVMSAIRLARAATGRESIITFAGSYHGHADAVLAEAGSGPATLGIEHGAGVPRSTLELVTTLPYNDAARARAAIVARRPAAVLVEPVAGNMGIVRPDPDFLPTLRRAVDDAGSLLILDEVITGFRFRHGAVSDALGVHGDLLCLGKIIGGGLPLAVYGGRSELMQLVAPTGPVYQAGTHAGNPLSVAAGLAALEVLSAPGVYERLDALGARLETGLQAALASTGVEGTINRMGSGLTLFFGPRPVRDHDGARASDHGRFRIFFWEMLQRGIYLAPSPYEAWFLTLAHREEEVDRTVQAARSAMEAVRSGPRLAAERPSTEARTETQAWHGSRPPSSPA